MNRCLLFVLLTIACASLDAQNNYTRIAAGFNYVMPKMIGKNFTSEPLKGIHVRSKFIELGYYAGKMTDASDTSKLFFNTYIGVNIPIRRLGFGRREYGIKGFLVAPFIAGDIGFMGRNGSTSPSVTLAPGVSLQLPYVLVDFRINAIIGFKNVPGLKREQYMIAPTIALQFDGLWDVMDPKIRFDHTYHGYYTWTETRRYQNSRYEDVVEYTTYYQPYSADVYRYNVGPHISIGPRISYWNLKNGSNKTFMYGLVQSGRASNFGYDLIAEQGKIAAPTGTELKAIRTMARLSINLNVSKGTNTFFTRFMIGGGLGYNWFTKDSPYEHSQSGEFFNLFCSLEFGGVGFSYEVNKAFYKRFDDQKYFSFQYRIPIERVLYRYRQLKDSK